MYNPKQSSVGAICKHKQAAPAELKAFLKIHFYKVLFNKGGNFVVMVRQAHHARRCIQSLSWDHDEQLRRLFFFPIINAELDFRSILRIPLKPAFSSHILYSDSLYDAPSCVPMSIFKLKSAANCGRVFVSSSTN